MGIACPKRVIMDAQCVHFQRSDSGDTLDNISIIAMMMFMGIVGLYYVRREELNHRERLAIKIA